MLKVNQRGSIKQLAAFGDTFVTPPPIPDVPNPFPMQAVPTSVATKGYDGAYYVSQLTGFPFPQGAANIHRIDPRGGEPTVYASGLTNVTDLAFNGRDPYAVQISSDGLFADPTGSTGALVKVKRDGKVPADHTVIRGGLPAPYGIAIKGGSTYVTTNAVAKDIGEVIKFRLP